MSWTDGSMEGLKMPIGKGSRLIIAHAGGSNGFVKDALLIFKSGSKSGDYHDEMNFDNFSKWLREQVLDHLEEPSVIVMDNASYHNKLKNRVPTSSATKLELVNWLVDNNIAHSSSMLKIELYDIVRQNKTSPQHQIDDLIRSAGHEVLRLPPYHPDLNPIENIWGIVKSRVSGRNTTFKLDDVKKIAEEEFAKITVEEWKKTCDKVIRTEDNYLSYEQSWDTFTDRIVIRPGEDSSTEVESDSEDDDDTTDDN